MARREGAVAKTAEHFAKEQREISVSEFFAKNRHLLGFDNPTRALLTSVKEAVDNALDACEEAHILPEVRLTVRQLSESRFLITVEDNGPGIVKEQLSKIFGKLLYGSKFHKLKMNRGQQGIGISAVCLYSQLTTGKPFKVISKTAKGKKATHMDIMINTTTNNPVVKKSSYEDVKREHGTMVEFEVEGRYIKGDKSIDEYLKVTHLANPHVFIYYKSPAKEKITFDRIVKELPPEKKEIKAHPYGVELGNLFKVIHESRHSTLKTALIKEFSRVSEKVAVEILKQAGMRPQTKPQNLEIADIEKIYNAIHKTKIMAPPTNCVAPIGEEKLIKAMENFAQGEFINATTRNPAVYRGNPFVVEAAINYMIPDYPQDEQVKVYRLANRVPLLYQPGACAITKAVQEVDWRGYGLSQSRGALPYGPMIVMVHIASVWVPFTSEAKESIAHYPEIIKEMKLAMQECGRKLSMFINKKKKEMHQIHRRSIFERYIPEVARALSVISKNGGASSLEKKMFSISRKVTDAQEKAEKEKE